MNKVYIIFDEEGHRYEVSDMKSMVRDMTPEELLQIFKSTSYFLMFEKYLGELHKNGTLKDLPHGKLNYGDVDAALALMAVRITNDLGPDKVTELTDEVQKDWETQQNS